MNASVQLREEHRRLLDRLVKLSGREEQHQFVDRHPQAREPAVVGALCGEATKLVRVDVQRAESVADLADRLADELGEPALRARGRRTRANVLHARGDYSRAIELYEEALAIYEELGESLQAGITRSSALQTLAFVGQHDRALEWAEEARKIFEAEEDALRLGRLDLNLGTIVYRQERFEESRRLMESAYDRLLEVGGPADVAHCLRNLATVHIGLHNFEEAEDVYNRARLYCEQGDVPLLLGEVEYNIAYLYYLRGEYTTAIELYRKTRDRCEETGEVYHRALCDLDEGEIYLELNLIDETLRTAEAAFRSFERLGMRYEAAKALTYLAIARTRQGKIILGLELFARAREIFVGERNQIWLGLIDLYKAVALARERRRYEAEGLTESAHAIFMAGGLHAKVAACEALSARLRLQAEDPIGARRLCDRALGRLRELDLPALDYQVHFISGLVEERVGDPAAALEAFQAAHERLARSRSSARAAELKIPLLESPLEVYESLVALLVEGGQKEPEPEAVFHFMETAKARNMVDLLAVHGLGLPTRKARSSQVERVRRLREELNWYYRRIDTQEVAQEPSGEELEELRRLTRDTEDALADSLREVSAVDPEFVSLQTTTTVGLDDIRAALPPESTLIELYTARDTIYACTLSERQLTVTPVSVASRVREIMRRYNDQQLKFRLGHAHVDRFAGRILDASRQVLHELYLELIEPLEEQLGPGGPLVIVPHGFLHWLPFSALHDGRGYLADRFRISYAPTAAVFHRCRTRSHSGGRGALLMSPSEKDRTELEALAAQLERPRVLSGDAASAGALRLGAGRARIVHLTASAEFRSDNPMFSSIELADSRLTLFDLYGLQLDAELAVLSGSGGRLGTISDGDEFLGLSRGLLYAGARSVVLPLWNTAPEIRGELLTSFYRALGSTPSRSEALGRAMLEIRERHEHPYYWASFVLVGDPG